MRFHEDARRAFWGDIFDTPNGDINVVILEGKDPIAWHRHQKQDDQIFLVIGKLRVQAIDTHGKRYSWTLDSENRGPTRIPRNWWHGYEALQAFTTLVQFNGPGKWDGSDEERKALGEFPWQ